MRETRMSGSEGGERSSSPYPYQIYSRSAGRVLWQAIVRKHVGKRRSYEAGLAR